MMPGRIGWKSIEITLYACLVKLGGNLLRWCPIRPPNSTDLTRQAYNVIPMDFHPIRPPNSLRWCLVEFGIICLIYLVDSMDFHPIWLIQPPNSTRHHLNEKWVVKLVKLGGNPLRLCLVESVEFDQCKSIWVIISMDFHPIWPIRLGIISMDFHPIWPGIISMKNKYKVAQYIWSRFDQQIDRFY